MKKQSIIALMIALAFLAACDTTGAPPTENAAPGDSTSQPADNTAQPATDGTDNTYPVPGDNSEQPNQQQPGTYPTMDYNQPDTTNQVYPTPEQ